MSEWVADCETRGITLPPVPGLPKLGQPEGVPSAALKVAEIKNRVSTYDFRHSRISQLANSGAPLPGVSFLAGHLNLATTARYVTQSADAASAALKLGRTKKGRS